MQTILATNVHIWGEVVTANYISIYFSIYLFIQTTTNTIHVYKFLLSWSFLFFSFLVYFRIWLGHLTIQPATWSLKGPYAAKSHFYPLIVGPYILPCRMLLSIFSSWFSWLFGKNSFWRLCRQRSKEVLHQQRPSDQTILSSYSHPPSRLLCVAH